MSPEELRVAIARGREQRNTEFKGPGDRRDKAFLAKVIRAVFGLANTPDGGAVVIGVDDDGTSLVPSGLTPEQVATWGYDDFHSSLTNYADPFVECEVGQVELDGRSYVAIEVRQFLEFPVLCKKDYQGTLRNGALYVRRRGKNETVEVPSHVEMREVVEHAAEARARAILASVSRVGFGWQPVEGPDDEARFDEEAADFL